jgi:hypothetical protein
MSTDYRKYLLEYYHNGAKWVIQLDATSTEDARERARQIYCAKVLGTVEAETPRALGFSARAACWLQNRLTQGARLLD